MANKEVLDLISAERVRRTTDLASVDPICAHDLLATLVSSWSREAELLAASQKKGWQSEAKTLGSAVVLLKLEITALEKRDATRPPVREPVTGPTPSWTDPTALDQLVANAQESGLGKLIAGNAPCPAHHDHSAHTWVGPRDPATSSDRWRCPGNGPLAESSSIADDVAAYLSGATDELAYADSGRAIIEQAAAQLGEPLTDTCVTTSLVDRPSRNTGMGLTTTPVIEWLGTNLATESAVHQEVDASMPDVHAEPLAPMFTDSTAPTSRARPVPPSMVNVTPYVWADFAEAAAPSTIPDHMSPSQLSTLDTCAAQARISRYDGNPGIPLWGAVGGTAFHRAVEEIERDVHAAGATGIHLAPLFGEVDAVWNKAFHAVIAEEIAKSGVPMTDWYASGGGKENYSWWLVEGGEMVKRYVTYRVKHDDGRKVLVLPDGRPAIELELSFNLWNPGTMTDPLPVKVILDIVWQLPDGSLEIWDHKTRRDYMGPIVDTIQLGTQGWALNHLLADLEDAGHTGVLNAITTRYFDARKGQLTDAFDPIERHPIEELEMRYADGDDKRRNRPAIPVRSNLCKACPVAYLCPVGSKL
jgi:hypothetical protein